MPKQGPRIPHAQPVDGPPPAHIPAGERTETANGEGWLVGGGEMGALIRSLDWSKTAIGPRESWPQSLRTAVSICLNSRFPILIWWGPEFVKLYNDAYRLFLGSKHPGSLGAPGHDVWPEIWHIIGPMLESVLHDGSATWSDDQLLMLERNGYSEECYFTFSYSPIRDEWGGVGGVFSVVSETTGRVLSERRLKALRELAVRTNEARTVQAACDGIATALAAAAADLPFALLYLLDRDCTTARLTGTAGIAPGGPASPEVVPLTLAREAARSADDEARRGAWPLARVVGSWETATVSDVRARFGPLGAGALADSPDMAVVVPVPAAGQQQLAGVLIMGLNPHRELDDAYRDFFGLVAGNVATALANARSYEEERERAEALAELDRAKTAFFSNVSHEFRTPLTLSLAPVEDALADGANPLPDVQRERLEIVRRNNLRLLKLVNTLLDFSRIEAGRVQATYEPTDLASYTTELAGVFRSLIEQAGLRFTMACSPLPEPVYVDRAMWEKIVLNLLSNAFKFTFEGEIAVRLRADTDGTVVLEVRDTGVGIPADELARVFERYHRIQGQSSRTYEGTGIGLALVQELVHQHGGSITATSAENRGTTFIVRIPPGRAHLPVDHIGRTDADAAVALDAQAYVEEAARWLPGAPGGTVSPAVAQEVAGTAGAAERRARIVLADDNADLRDYLSRLLGARYQVTAVPDGAAALAAARERPPDLVLSDVMMPGLDGFALLRELRGDPRTQDVPVVLLSARAGEEATIEGLEAGADDYLIKPFSAGEVLARVRTHVELGRIRRELAARAHELEEANGQLEALLGIVTHELRNPLAAIHASLQLAQRRIQAGAIQAGATTAPAGAMASARADAAARVITLLERAERQAERIDRLVGDLLDASRVAVDKLTLEQRECDLAAVVQRAVEDERMMHPARMIVYAQEQPGPVPVMADVDRIGQVVTNYLTNALKYSPDNALITVSLECAEGQARVAVRDCGPGIPPGDLEHIWDRFHRVPGIEARAGADAGLGLGLYICRTLIERHGGTVAVDSVVGQGSTFSFTLPLAKPAPDR